MMELWSILHTGTATGTMTAPRSDLRARSGLAVRSATAVSAGCGGAATRMGRRAAIPLTGWAAGWPRG